MVQYELAFDHAVQVEESEIMRKIKTDGFDGFEVWAAADHQFSDSRHVAHLNLATREGPSTIFTSNRPLRCSKVSIGPSRPFRPWNFPVDFLVL